MLNVLPSRSARGALARFGLIATAVLLTTVPWQAVAAQRVMLDPGHSPQVPGATGCSGEKEYHYNRLLAETVSAKLTTAGLTSSLTDAGNSLPQRAAQAIGYDLLLSLHHDSVQPRFIVRTKQGGVCSDKASGFSLFVSTRNPAYLQSLEYATRLAKALIARGLKPSLHHAESIAGEGRTLLSKELGIYQYDELQILASAPAPAVLFEAAVIVNRADEARASTPAFRRLIADAIAEAVKGGGQHCNGTCRLPVLQLH